MKLRSTCSPSAGRVAGTRWPAPCTADWATAWHEFGVEYSQSGIKFALDGQVYHSPPSSSIFWAHTTPYYVILNTAVGGPWPGPPSANTTFPAYHQIDYVRVAEPTTVESSVL